MRQAPDGGYDFAAKEAFRAFVWRHLTPQWIEPTSAALLMPSIEGLEIQTARTWGWADGQLHVVDKNPAIVATLKRRHPDLHTYGVSVERAHERIADKGTRLVAASIDLCTSANWQSAGALLRQCAMAKAWRDGAGIAINVLRGREDSSTRSAIDPQLADCVFGRMFAARWTVLDASGSLPTANDVWRAGVVLFGMGQYFSILKDVGVYRSVNGQTFLTLFVRVYSPEHVRRMARSPQYARLVADIIVSDATLGNIFYATRGGGIGNPSLRLPLDEDSVAVGSGEVPFWTIEDAEVRRGHLMGGSWCHRAVDAAVRTAMKRTVRVGGRFFGGMEGWL